MSRFRQFGAITKIEDQPDGTIKVWGIASSETQDHVGETVTAAAMKGALPDYSRFPALREMHEPSAAGKVLEADVDDAGVTNICALVVDPLAITKVRAGVYAGFSIGGKVLKRDPTDRSVITGLRLVEISLVDSPCNPDAVISMWKADMTDYNPSGGDVVTKAKAMAAEAGSPRYKDFLFKAREALIAEALAELGDDEAGEGDDAAKADAVAGEASGPPDAPAEEAAQDDAQDAQDGEGDKEAADGPDAPPDPAQALQDAIGKAKEVVDGAKAGTDVPQGPFADMAKAGAALRLISVDDPIAKGLWQVETLACIMDRFQSLAASIAYEAEAEKDGSAAPAKAADVLASIGELLIMMAKEEVAEALAGLPGADAPAIVVIADDDAEIVLLANDIVDLVKADTDLMEKAGARHNKADADRIQKSHDHMAALGAKCDSGNCEKSDDADDLAKANADLAAENDRLAKELSDGATAITELTKRFGDTVADLKKRLEAVEERAAPPKTAGGVRAISKAEDAAPGGADAPTISADDLQKVIDSLPEAERGQLLLRVALSQPKLVQPARAAA